MSAPCGILESASVLLEMWDDALGMFASLAGSTSPDDVADFERGVRDLKRIILARR